MSDWPRAGQSRAAGVANVDAADVEAAQKVLAETQVAVLPLVRYLDSLRWVFIAAALARIAVAIYARIEDSKGVGGDRRPACRARRQS